MISLFGMKNSYKAGKHSLSVYLTEKGEAAMFCI